MFFRCRSGVPFEGSILPYSIEHLRTLLISIPLACNMGHVVLDAIVMTPQRFIAHFRIFPADSALEVFRPEMGFYVAGQVLLTIESLFTGGSRTGFMRAVFFLFRVMAGNVNDFGPHRKVRTDLFQSILGGLFGRASSLG